MSHLLNDCKQFFFDFLLSQITMHLEIGVYSWNLDLINEYRKFTL